MQVWQLQESFFAWSTNLYKLYFRFRRCILLAQTKKVFSLNYGNCTISWKPWRWVRLNLIHMMRDIYINPSLKLLTKFTSSSRSTEFKDILPCNISQIITKTVPISMVMSCAMKQGISFWIWWKVNGSNNLDNGIHGDNKNNLSFYFFLLLHYSFIDSFYSFHLPLHLFI